MVRESPLKECSLFLIQYVPDLARGEFLNIGDRKSTPREQYLGCLFTDDLRRIKRFHPQADLDFLSELQQDFEQQIDEHTQDLEDFIRNMQSSFSTLIHLAPPKVCLLRDPQAELRSFFERYVGPRAGGPEPTDTRLRIKQRLTSALVRANVWGRLEKRVPAFPWTHPGDRFTFDYSYRPPVAEGKPNGHVKFIHALSLKRDTELAKILVYTLERVRRKEPAQLTAVIEGLASQGDQAAALCQRILEEGSTTLQPLAGVDEFAENVRRELAL